MGCKGSQHNQFSPNQTYRGWKGRLKDACLLFEGFKNSDFIFHKNA
jgi:hypothetical protein